MNELISVIIPVYNVELYVEQCIRSLLQQSYSNIEIILVDDGSTDSSGEICDNWKYKDDRIHVIHKTNGGLSDARNYGIKVAQGQFLMFVDSDDWVDSDFCKKAAELIQNCDIAVFGYYLYDDVTGFVDTKKFRISGQLDNFHSMEALVSGEISDYAWNKIYRAQLFSNVRYPVGMVWEDIGTTYRLFANAKNINFGNDVLYYYRQRSGSISYDPPAHASVDIFEHMYKQHIFCKEHYSDLVKYTQKRIVLHGLICFMKNYQILNAIPRYTEIKKILLNSSLSVDLPFSKKVMLFIYKRSEKLFCWICCLYYSRKVL